MLNLVPPADGPVLGVTCRTYRSAQEIVTDGADDVVATIAVAGPKLEPPPPPAAN
jgi:hypothetical protein